MADLPRSRLLQLIKVTTPTLSPRRQAPPHLPYLTQNLQAQCQIFSQTYNPDRLRLGNKVLRQRLRGPALASYYPRKSVTFRDLADTFKPLGLETWNEEEEDRVEAIQMYVFLLSLHWVFLWGLFWGGRRGLALRCEGQPPSPFGIIEGDEDMDARALRPRRG